MAVAHPPAALIFARNAHHDQDGRGGEKDAAAHDQPAPDPLPFSGGDEGKDIAATAMKRQIHFEELRVPLPIAKAAIRSRSSCRRCGRSSEAQSQFDPASRPPLMYYARTLQVGLQAVYNPSCKPRDRRPELAGSSRASGSLTCRFARRLVYKTLGLRSPRRLPNKKSLSQLVAAKDFNSMRETGLEPARPCGH
jgi:hypothetical protein